MKRVPVHIVTGTPDSAKSALVARLIAERENWATLALRACPCCTGRVELQVALARVLRGQRPDRILVELRNEDHLRTLERVLAERPLGQYIAPGRNLLLPADAGVRAEDLEVPQPALRRSSSS